MDFDLSEEHRLLRKSVRGFVEKEIAPKARRIDETGEFPWPALKGLAKLGLLGLNVPEQFGGAGADHVERGNPAGRDRPRLRLDGADRRGPPRAGVRAARRCLARRNRNSAGSVRWRRAR